MNGREYARGRGYLDALAGRPCARLALPPFDRFQYDAGRIDGEAARAAHLASAGAAA